MVLVVCGDVSEDPVGKIEEVGSVDAESRVGLGEGSV